MHRDMKTTVEFTERYVTFEVRNGTNGPVYRDKAHLGGPWANASKTANNPSLRLTFRNALKAALVRLAQETSP